MSSVSLCMIVKNEHEVLARALANWRDYADELVIVDTGSTDDTCAIAEAHGATLLHYQWEYPGNKGAARNMGLDAATSDWVVVLDADEIVRDGLFVRTYIERSLPDVTAINVHFENHIEGVLTLEWYQVRIFKRGLYRYIHREHELPYWQGAEEDEGQVMAPQVIFEHRPPDGRQGVKQEAMMRRLMLDVTEHPLDPSPAYFLHRQYMIGEEWQTAYDTGLAYLERPDVDKCEPYGNLATCCLMLNRPNEAVDWLCRALAAQPHRRIWWVRIAEIYLGAAMYLYAYAYLRGAEVLPLGNEWQWEPLTYNERMQTMIAECQEALYGRRDDDAAPIVEGRFENGFVHA